jgi:nitroreductase
MTESRLAEAVAAALRAPSLLNSQPWRWRLAGDVAELRADGARQLSNVDPDGHMLMLSCGVALHHAVVALHAAGFAGAVERVDDPRRPDLVALLRLGEPQPADDSGYRAVLRRRTDVEALRVAAGRHGVRLHALATEQIPVFGQIVDRAGALLRSDVAVAADMQLWTHRAACSRDGVALSGTTASGPRVVRPRDFTGGRRPELPYGAGTDRGTVYLVLATVREGRRDWLRAGEALSDVWLTLTARGLAASPISEVVEISEPRAALRRLIGGDWPAVALRVGVPADPQRLPPATRRRHVADVVDDEPAD